MFAALLLLTLANPASASSAPATYAVPWAVASEVLTYKSCGCADSCWVAELRERKSKKLKARLRCDCSSLLGRYPAQSSERTLQESCSDINQQDDKMGAVSQAMKRLVGGEPAAAAGIPAR
ncbi:hypothetical protein ASD15_09740 [Massilia sp. Root351]|nr:hypothetical protein ASD15_09740 [Massilia sp. Root351]